MMNHLMMTTMMMMLRRMRRTKRRRKTQLQPTLLMYRQMILSPQDENTKAFETDESASTPSTILPPPLGNVKSLKDNIRVKHLES
uniref:Uncharacterized protein n=1 Tax=Tanacetum cinerariifolium TaxID=118510 RepID=A0A699UZ59_TANCI|nr:hypothetical protein [Tanacetum cinerariifolium]